MPLKVSPARVVQLFIDSKKLILICPQLENDQDGPLQVINIVEVINGDMTPTHINLLLCFTNARKCSRIVGNVPMPFAECII